MDNIYVPLGGFNRHTNLLGSTVLFLLQTRQPTTLPTEQFPCEIPTALLPFILFKCVKFILLRSNHGITIKI